MRDNPERDDLRLPLTEPVADSGAAGMVNEADIRRLVDSFYGRVRKDVVLGPIFTRHVADWSAHMPKMYDFWSTVVLRTGRYSGRPIDVHRKLPEISLANFERWIGLWESTVDDVIGAPNREMFTMPARRMAASMAASLAAS